eukprot:1775587-Amphidinium_carterae.1
MSMHLRKLAVVRRQYMCSKVRHYNCRAMRLQHVLTRVFTEAAKPGMVSTKATCSSAPTLMVSDPLAQRKPTNQQAQELGRRSCNCCHRHHGTSDKT